MDPAAAAAMVALLYPHVATYGEADAGPLILPGGLVVDAACAYSSGGGVAGAGKAGSKAAQTAKSGGAVKIRADRRKRAGKLAVATPAPG